MFPYISLLCSTFTLWPRKSSIFPIFVIYNPRFCPFVHFVIVLNCIYCPIYRPILYLCFLGGNHPRIIHQKYGYHCCPGYVNTWILVLVRLDIDSCLIWYWLEFALANTCEIMNNLGPIFFAPPEVKKMYKLKNPLKDVRKFSSWTLAFSSFFQCFKTWRA